MNILFTADLHIKLGQKNVPIEWVKNRFKLFLEQFHTMQLESDLVILGGDIFDKLPNMEEIELYFDLIASLVKPTILYSGNHEMLKKDSTFLTFLKKPTQRLNKLVTIIDDYYTLKDFDCNIDFIPYNKLKQYFPQDIDFHSSILCTHVRGNIPPHVKAEVPLDLFKNWKVVLAGDLHSYENSQENILYPGSPYTTSFHRNKVDTGAILLNTKTFTHRWLKFKLPQLIKLTVHAGEPTLQTDYDHTVYEVEGTLSDLGKIEDSDLVDKKLVRRTQDSQLILDPNLTLAEEVKEYLTYILQLDDDTISDIIKEFYNNLDKLEF